MLFRSAVDALVELGERGRLDSTSRRFTAEQFRALFDPKGVLGALFDPLEGVLDPNGATQAYAGAAKGRGAEVIQHNRVLSLGPGPDGGWLVVAVWESKDACDAFVSETLVPALPTVSGGLEGPPQERAAEVANLLTA